MRVASSLLVFACAALGFSQTLTVGSDAPPIKVREWVKSSPVDRFQPGRLYVLDFWATWCPSCRETIPELTGLAKKYAGKVVFAGISIAEKQSSDADLSYIPVVRKFVRAEGGKMDYHVAIDRPDGTMAQSWMLAAGETGIPKVFIVDRHGRIAYIGEPAGVDRVLSQELRGTFKLNAESHRGKGASTPTSNDPKANGTGQALAEAISRGDWKVATRTCNLIIANDPKQENEYGQIKFLALLQTDVPGAYSYGHRLSGGIYKGSAIKLRALSQMLLSEEFGPKNPDLAFALDLAQQSVRASRGMDPEALDTLANAEVHTHHLEEALGTERRALKVLDALQATSASNQIRRQVEKRIQTIQTSKP